MDVALSVAIATHSSRASRAAALARKLQTCQLDSIRIVEHVGPPSRSDATLNSAKAWRPESRSATHHAVIQDDAFLSDEAVDRMSAYIALQPNAIVSFFAEWTSRSGQAVRMGCWTGASLVELANSSVSAVAIAAPVLVADAIARTIDSHHLSRDSKIVAEAAATLGVPVLVSSPNLVDHDRPWIPSLLRNERPLAPRRSAAHANGPPLPYGAVRTFDAVPYIAASTLVEVVGLREAPMTYTNVSVEGFLQSAGIAPGVVAECFGDWRDGGPDFVSDLDLAPPMLNSIWTVCWVTGFVLSEYPELNLFGGAREHALRTLASGPLKRTLSERAIDAMGSELTTLARAGIQSGYRGGSLAPPRPA